MTIDTVLITIQSLLDAKPLMNEPGQQDSKTYNDYVRYTTWRWLLLDYIDSETDVSSKMFLQSYLKEQGPRIWQQLQNDKKAMGSAKSVTSFYRGPGQSEAVDWTKLENDVRSAILKVGGSTFGFEGPSKVLSSASVTTEVSSSSTAPAMPTAREKRKLDALDTTMRPEPAKKPAANNDHTSPSQNTAARPSRQKRRAIIVLSDDDDE